jgi:hypothetical protein
VGTATTSATNPTGFYSESSTSLLSLVLGAAHHHGAPVTLEMVHEAMGRTAERVGTDDFGNPELPHQHRPALSPFEWVMHGREKLSDALDLYEVPSLSRPAAVGFACSGRSTKVARPSIR